MGNTQSIWILYDALLTFNFLNAEEQTTAVEKHCIMKEPVYFRDVLASKWKSGNVLHWERYYALFP